MPVLVGTSGWMYADWKGRYYPDRFPQSKWFPKVMADFQTVELNVSFYRLPKREVFESWRAQPRGRGHRRQSQPLLDPHQATA